MNFLFRYFCVNCFNIIYPGFKFFSVFKLKSYINIIKIPNNKGQKKNMFLGAFQIYNTFILYRFDSKESARDNHKARQTDTRYYPVNEIIITLYPGAFSAGMFKT